MFSLPAIIVGSIGLFFGIVLSIASRRFTVPRNQKTEAVRKVLPDVNCGVCGYATCDLYAQALTDRKEEPGNCAIGGEKTASEIGEILGLEPVVIEKQIAIIHCKGGHKEARVEARYRGLTDCNAAVLIQSNFKVCTEGCLGLGSCVQACTFEAIKINENGIAQIEHDRCTGCGRCVTVCPRNLIELIPKVHKIYVACNNHGEGKPVLEYCTIGCTACGVCVKATPSGSISMENNVPKLDYSKGETFILAAYKCPNNCFVDLVKARPRANIDTKCTGCGECMVACPVRGAITGTIGERHHIDKTKCIGCGMCLDICPPHAITLWGGIGYADHEKLKRIRY